MPPTDQHFRSIRPAPPPAPPQQVTTAGGDRVGPAGIPNIATLGESKDRKRRRPYVLKACEGCRQRKSACNGGQPICSMCLRKGSPCIYKPVSQAVLNALPTGTSLVDYETNYQAETDVALLDLLRISTNDQGLEAVRALKEGEEPAEISSRFRSLPGFGLEPSQIALNRALLPPTRSSLEFELMMRHPITYPAWAPVEVSKLNLDYLLLPSRIRWAEAGSFVASSPTDSSHPHSVSPFGNRYSENNANLLKVAGPLKLPPVYDNRLLELDISKWTNLPVTAEFAVTVLSLYLEADHPLTPLFDIDVFLDGLLERNQFCSRLLVSALFSWACGYAAFEPEATIVGHAFYEEAKRLWKREKVSKTDGICTLAALEYIAITAVSLGAGAEYVECLNEIFAMAKRLQLFNIDPAEAPTADVQDAASLQASSQIAWALFNTLTLLSMHIHKRLIEYPPRLPVPEIGLPPTGVDLSQADERRQYLNVLFKENCKFFLIVHDIVQLMYGPKQTPYAKAFSLSFAEQTYQRFLAWADKLPLNLAQGSECTHHAMLLHICYHLAILDLFRPLVRQEDTSRARMRSFDSKEATPRAVHAASINQLKRIVLFYRQTYPESSFSLFWHSALLYLANAMLREATTGVQSPEWRFYFRLCLASYQTLYSGFRLSKGIAQSLLTMALEKRVMTVKEASSIRKDLEKRGRHHDISDRVPEALVVDLDLAVTNPSEAQAERLVQKFTDLLVHDAEPTQGGSSKPP